MHYVAYGSNMNLKQMEYRCPNSKVVCNGIIEDYQLYFNYHADIKKKIGCYTDVVIWDIAKEDWSMLDLYEGYPKYYRKEKIKVKREDGKTETCIIYLMNNPNEDYCLPSKEYFECIENGYINNNIDTDALYDALVYTNDKIDNYIIKKYSI